MAHNRQHNEGRPSTDVFGNSVVLTGQALIDSNEEAASRHLNLPLSDTTNTESSGGYGKKRIGQQSRGQMDLTKGKKSSILTSPY